MKKTSHFVLLFILSFFIFQFASADTYPYPRETRNFAKDDNKYWDIVKLLLGAKEKAWQLDASAQSVEKVLTFYSDSLQYKHVLPSGKTFELNGKEILRDGLLSHLGETRNVKLEVLKFITRQNVVIVETNLYREIKTEKAWEASAQKSVAIFEFDQHDKIKTVTEYL